VAGVLIVGCGDIGRRVARLYRARGEAVSGTARRPERAAELAAEGIAPLLADLDEPASLVELPTADALVFYLAPPPAGGVVDPRMTAFLSGPATARPPSRIVYVSTSAVYGDCGGAWVTEERPPAPSTDRGRRRLAAETALLEWQDAAGIPVVILRVPGIYGAGRLPVRRLQEGLPVLRAEDSPYTNRIHADDLAAVCVAAAERGQPGAAYNVSDGHPSTMTDYFNRIADLLELPRPPAVDMAEARRVLSPGMLSFLQDSRRLDNRRMCEELGVTLRYPDLEAGLRACRP
jgi:nucleoside-diphosphate-sugar epimerase